MSYKDSSNSAKIDNIFYELQCSSSGGCSKFEEISQTNRRRPCFKKIELLLIRLRQELDAHQNIVSNINSQGTAWIIKDFIFVFTRIVNAWIIMRGYIFDSSKGLDEYREIFDPEFIEKFLEWQEATLKFINPLISTVENLNLYSQNKDLSKMKKDKPIRNENAFDKSKCDEKFLETFQKSLFSPHCLSDSNSVEIQLQSHKNNSYFRAGVLKPLMISHTSLSSMGSPLSPQSPSDNDLMSKMWLSMDDLDHSPIIPTMNLSAERLYNRGRSNSFACASATFESYDRNPFDFNKPNVRSVGNGVKKGLVDQFNSMELNNEIPKQLDIEIKSVLEMESELSKMYKNDTSKIIYLLHEINKLPNVGECAFWINMMIQKIKIGQYGNIADILCEMKILMNQAKSMMKDADDQKKLGLKAFVNDIESIMSRKAFE